MLSGSNDAETARDSLKLGALDFIHKPFNVEEFVLKVDRAVLSEKQRQIGSAVLDIGAGMTTMVVFKGGNLLGFFVNF